GPLWRYGISTAGGALVYAQLDEYESTITPGDPVQLVPENQALLSHRLRIGERVVDLSSLRFEPSARDLALTDSAPATLTLTHAGEPRIQLTYTFDPSTYVFDVQVQATGTAAAPQLLLDMGPTLRANDANIQEDQRALAYVVNSTARG